MNKIAKGIAYVSVWVMIWGTIASLVDFALLGADLYENGSIGQASTFATYGLAAIVIAWKLAPKFLNETD
jgi:TM2 domain-containing membrane protein YozV